MAGLSFHIDINDQAAQEALAGLESRGINLEPAMDEIGSMLVADTLNNFEHGTAPDGTPWTPSQRVLEAQGAAQTLVDSGRLWASMTHAAGHNYVDVGTNVVYGAIHQLSGKAGRGLAATIPARPFLGVSPSAKPEIVAILKDHLLGGAR